MKTFHYTDEYIIEEIHPEREKLKNPIRLTTPPRSRTTAILTEDSRFSRGSPPPESPSSVSSSSSINRRKPPENNVNNPAANSSTLSTSTSSSSQQSHQVMTANGASSITTSTVNKTFQESFVSTSIGTVFIMNFIFKR